jgi:hypothetical protein
MRLRGIVLIVISSLAIAKEAGTHQSGRLTEMDSVACGMEEKNGQGLMSELSGADSNYRRTVPVFCPEYVLESDKLVFHIRPRNEKHPAILPVGEMVQFRLEKDHMLLRPADADEKEREYEVMSIKMHGSAREAASVSDAANH